MKTIEREGWARAFQVEEADVLPAEEADSLGGTLLGPGAYSWLVDDEDCLVLKPNGEPLVAYRARVLDPGVCRRAWDALRAAATPTDNRGMAAGELAKDADSLSETTTARRLGDRSPRTRLYFRPVKRDGTLSKTNYAKVVNSGIVGYFDRYVRIPYCRTTAYSMANPDKMAEAMPFFRAVAKVFAADMPDRYEAQMEMIKKTHSDWVLHGTPWTTVTVNKNFQTAVHKDAGDYAPGFGVMSVLQGGQYNGGVLVFPEYRVGVNMRTAGVCLADVHEWHANTPIVGIRGTFERISVVCYYRADMYRCGSAAEELDRAKHRKPGDPMYGQDEIEKANG